VEIVERVDTCWGRHQQRRRHDGSCYPDASFFDMASLFSKL